MYCESEALPNGTMGRFTYYDCGFSRLGVVFVFGRCFVMYFLLSIIAS